MSFNDVKVQSIIETTFLSVINKLINNGKGNAVKELFIQADAEAGELMIYDDNENLLGKIILYDLINSETKSFEKKVAAVLKSVLTQFREKDMFSHRCFLQPFSINLVDSDFNVLEELLFVDDDIYRPNEPLLKDLDSELDGFLKGLLSDMPK